MTSPSFRFGRRPRTLVAVVSTSLAAVVMLGTLSAIAGAAPPCADTFTGANMGLWSTSTNWSTNAAPTGTQVACLGGETVVLSSGSQTADSVQGGSLDVTAGSLTLTSTTNDSSIVDLSLDNAGILTATGQTVDVTGNFEWGMGGDQTEIDTTIDQTGGGSFAIDGSGLGGPVMTGGSITTTSPVSISNENFGFTGLPQTLSTTSTITLSSGEQLSSLSFNSTITAAAVASQSGGVTYGFWGAQLVLTGGTTTVNNNSTLQAGTLTLEGGTLDDNGGIAPGSGFTLSSTITSGTLTGSGNIAGNVTNVGGTVAPPYAAFNQLTISGSYTQDAGGTLAIGMNSSDTSLLRVAGGLTVAGDLVVTDENGFTPFAGELFDVVLSGSGPTGTFTLTGPSAGEYSPVYASQVVRLIAGSVALSPPAGGVGGVKGKTNGQTLTCQPGTWTNSPTGYTYQWNLDASPVTTATASDTYSVATADQGHSLTCTVVASNGAGPGTPATSAPVPVPSGTTTTPTGPTTTPVGPSKTLGVPVDTVPPRVSGTPTPGHRLACSNGTWTNGPTGYIYRWARDGVALAGATTPSYAVEIGDEAGSLTCTVTASNAAGPGVPSTSAAIVVAEPGTLHCVKPTGRVSGLSVGPLALGFSRAHARHTLPRFAVTGNGLDDFCLYGGWGIRVGYPTGTVLDRLSPAERTHVSGRIVLALTANPFYALDGVRPGMLLSAVAKRLGVGKAFHIGLNYWYLVPGAAARGVLKVRHGVIQEIGLANKRLTAGNRASQHHFLSSFTKA
jgi:hypothetical protein